MTLSILARGELNFQMAVMSSLGEHGSGWKTINSQDWTLVTMTTTIPKDTSVDSARICQSRGTNAVGKYIDIKMAKLELGSEQTLAHQDSNGNWVLNDPPPDPGIELLKCKRYYQILDGVYLAPSTGYSAGVIWQINLNVSMRVKPTIILPTIDGTTPIVSSKVINGLILGGWSWGQYCAASNPNNVQIQMINTDKSQHDNAHSLLAVNAPIALSADL